MKKYSITYRIGSAVQTVEAEGFGKAQDQVAMILNAGGEVIVIREQVIVLEVIDYTLSRKGHRQYIPVGYDQEYVQNGGNWKTLSACKAQIEKLGMIFTGVETVNMNYKHWADFQPVKKGQMLDEVR